MIGPRLASATFADTRGPIELRVEDRLESLAIPIRDMSAAMVAILIGSIALHALLVATALVTGRVAPPAAPREITVEIVQDAPKPPVAAAPQAKPAPAKPAPPRPEQSKVEPPKPAAETKPIAPPKPPIETKPAPADDAKPARAAKPRDSATDEAKALEAELASLRAEQAALKASEAEAARAATDRPGAGEAGAGQAIAMPSIAGDGDGVGYQQLVFSNLAKAKGDSAYHGKSGVAGVRFEMDQAGQLVRAEVVASSGDAALDAKALDIVHRAAPFPPPPTEADRIVFANVNFIAPKPQ